MNEVDGEGTQGEGERRDGGGRGSEVGKREEDREDDKG